MEIPGMRVRTLLSAVAVAALILWSGITIRRSFAYSRLAREHEAAESRALAVSTNLNDRAWACLSYSEMWRIRAEGASGKAAAEMRERQADLIEAAKRWGRQAEEARAKYAPIAAHHQRLARKYSLAAGRPWLPVAPDPLSEAGLGGFGK